MPDHLVKVNLASSKVMFRHGWVNVDISDLKLFAFSNKFIFKRADLRTGIPFPTSNVDVAVVSHFLEHLPYEGGAKFLADLRRAMKTGASVRFAVPDARLLAKSYLDGSISNFDVLGYSSLSCRFDAGKFYELLAGPNHLSFYDADLMVNVLKAAGFRDVRIMGFRESRSNVILQETIDMFPHLSVYAEAIK